MIAVTCLDYVLAATDFMSFMNLMADFAGAPMVGKGADYNHPLSDGDMGADYDTNVNDEGKFSSSLLTKREEKMFDYDDSAVIGK
jgi:hypothetical protein